MRAKEKLARNYGPWAIVAGASEGLGAAFADVLAGSGLNLILVARRRNLLEELAERLNGEHGVAVRICVADLAHPDAADTIISLCEDIDPGLLVHNAAFAPMGDFASMPIDRIRRVVDVNVCGATGLVHALLPLFLRRHRAGIVLMSSLAGDLGSPRLATYAASKAFLTSFAKGLWYELRSESVDVTACVAGAIRTPGFEQAKSTGGSGDAPGTLDPDRVARSALGALGRKPVVVPGIVNGIARFVLRRLLPEPAAVHIMAASTSGLEESPARRNDAEKERHGE